MKSNTKFLITGLVVCSYLISPGFRNENDLKQEAKNQKVEIFHKEKEKRVDIIINKKPFTSYLYSSDLKKPILFPIRTAKGKFVTRGFPLEPRSGERTDHPHQVGLWFAHGNMNGHDFWNNSNHISPEHKGPFGVIVHKSIKSIKTEVDEGVLEVVSEWVNSQSKLLVREETKFVFSGNLTSRKIERITKLTALTNVMYKDNKEGLLGIRVSRELEGTSEQADIFIDATGKPSGKAVANSAGVTGVYRNSDGKEGKEVNNTRSKWVELAGDFDNEPVSIVIIDHPKNPGFPGFWNARDYGLFATNPLGLKHFSGGKEELNLKIMEGQSVTFRHKIIIHTNSVLSDDYIEDEFKKFSEKY